MTLLEIVPGDTFQYTANVTNPYEGVVPPYSDLVGTAYDLTGCTLFFAMKRSVYDADYVFSLSWEDGGDSDGITVADPTLGVAVVELTPAQTAPLEQWAYRWDFQMRNAAGKVRTIDYGSVMILRQVNSATVAP